MSIVKRLGGSRAAKVSKDLHTTKYIFLFHPKTLLGRVNGSLNPYYLTAPEVELNHGYCDFFLMPDLTHWPMVKHSYILELKYLPQTATEEKAEAQWTEAVGQIKTYAQGEKVKQLAQGTTLHPIAVQIKGYEAVRVEEWS